MDDKDRVMRMIEADGRRNFLNGQVAEKGTAITELGKCRSYLEAAAANFSSAKESALKSGIVFDAEVFKGFVSQVTKAVSQAEADRQKHISEMKDIEAEIDTLQAELKKDGIELNIGQSRPKTSVV